MVDNTCKSSRSLSVRETALKVLTRWYYTPSRLHRLFPQTSPLCFRGCGLTGTLVHIFWDCPSISLIWCRISEVAPHWRVPQYAYLYRPVYWGLISRGSLMPL
ncbi:unnamed protein product [Staurois parvus]|uniref:Reverse transcriptase zinc-binding domain-containing protein n=1 Tax=Staurois parvus TaxID=386267 RepID=A0ABN9HHY3_9NEOB|nr:unnamed protein product [Staurois parvus]